MKNHKLIITLILFTILLGSEASRSFQNEKGGYNGFDWGLTLEEFLKNDKGKFKKKGHLYFGDQINGIDVDIGYEFFKDRLYGVLIDFPSKKRSSIIEHFITIHGKPTLKRGKYFYWIGTTSKIVIKNKDVRILSIELEKELEKEKVTDEK